MDSEITIRTAAIEDAQALLDIYAYYVEETAITYEYDVPSLAEFESRIAHTLEEYPYLVAEMDGKIVGYSYAGAFHPRAAYHWGAEMTVYLDHTVRGHQIGAKLYSLVEEILKAQGVIKTIALITPPPSEEEKKIYNSVAFHEKMGYQMLGCMNYAGYKFNRWYQVVVMEKMIGIPEEHMQPIKTFDEVRNLFAL